MASSKSVSAATSSSAEAASVSKDLKKLEIVDTTTDEVAWYNRFLNDFCLGDENHPLLAVRR